MANLTATEQIIDYIKEIGQLNRVVSPEIYGCVNIPLGPYPPPFCDTITDLAVVATTQFICPTDSEGNVMPSIDGRECVVSTIRNNFFYLYRKITIHIIFFDDVFVLSYQLINNG